MHKLSYAMAGDERIFKWGDARWFWVPTGKTKRLRPSQLFTQLKRGTVTEISLWFG